MKTFKKYIEELNEPIGVKEMDELSESRIGKAAVTAVAAKHRSSRMKAAADFKKASAAFRKVRSKKELGDKLDALAEGLESAMSAGLEQTEMSGANISVGVISALTAEDAGRKSAKKGRK